MIIDFANYFLKHIINRNYLDLKRHKLDFFIYIISEKYIFKEYYKIIIDIRAFK